MTTFNLDGVTYAIQIDGKDLPPSVNLSYVALHTNTGFCVPMLDFVLSDPLGVVGEQIFIKDKTLVEFYITQTDKPVQFTKYRVASITPSRQRTITVYYVNCYYETNFIFADKNWQYTGLLPDAIADILNNDPQVVEFESDIVAKQPATFTKYANESYSHYLRRVLMPACPKDNTSFYCYYHNGYQVKIYDVLNRIRNFSGTNNNGFKLYPNSFIRSKVISNSLEDNLRHGAYGANVWQFDVDSGDYKLANTADSYIKYNANIGNKKDFQSVFTSMNQGNHPVNYIDNVLNNSVNNGIFNFRAMLQLNYYTGLTGLEIIPFYYQEAKFIPVLLSGISTVIADATLWQYLYITTNTIDQSILSSLGV